MAVYTPHHFEYQCSPNRIFQMSAIFTKNILQTKYMFLYDLTRKKQSYSYEIEVVLIGFALQTQKDTNLLTTSVYRTYFEWILMKYTVETKDI